MDVSHQHTAEKPMSIPEITRRAEDFEYNPFISLRSWLRTADTLLKEARIYELEGKDQQAYLLLFRHAKLVLDYLRKHPDARIPENRSVLEALERTLPRTLHRMELLKPRITRRYEEYVKYWQEEEAQRATLARRNGYPDDHRAYERDFPAAKRFSATASRALAAGEHRDLAVRLAHREIRRRETARKATRQAGISWAEEQARRTAGEWGNWEEALARDDGADEDDLQPRMREARRLIDAPLGASRHLEGQRFPQGRIKDRIPSAYHYPTVPKREELRYEDWIPTPLQPSASLPAPTRGILKPPRPPELPPKDESVPSDTRPPLPPYPHHQADSSHSAAPPVSTARSLEPVSRSSTATPPASDPQPSNFTFKPSAYLESGTPLRTIFLPPDLRTTFLKIASPNTRANLETCGILCGTLISNAWFISRLVIPEQENTSDTCEMINEGALFDYCDGEDLIVVGWIHTHPTQSCFMSSRDLHTHSGFQVCMPESIAIVCAPSQTPSWGVFRLTDPPGLKTILNCHQSGLFHPHPEGDMYTDALRPGHVFEAKGLEFHVADLRPI
ncbi:MAG: hypothetical protein M1816_005561 [Peltula sp. TS41687]|nr:MAG: hypothetical protein M1816_005561 [Peltula sp. TS41687]